jgi:sporulation protein YlmC with PRC-barrel domain
LNGASAAHGPTIGAVRDLKQPDHIQEAIMKRTSIFVLAGLALTMPAVAQAQVAGSTVLGVAVTELRDVATGWSARREVLNQAVFNDKNESIGRIDDIVIAPDKAVSYVIVNAGGFLGVTKHDVAIPVAQLKQTDGKLVLPGATRDALRTSPPFEYAPR